MKRSPLKRSSVESVKAWRARSAGLRSRSRKMQAVYVERRAFVREFLTAHSRCEVTPCGALSVDVHEVLRRSKGAALYPGQPGKKPTRYMAVCRQHHNEITFNPKWAREQGYEVRDDAR